MKRIATLMLLMTFSIPAFANNKDSATVYFPTPTMIGSKIVPAGHYKMAWVGAGPQIQVTFSLDEKVLLTTPATLTSADNSKDGATSSNPTLLVTSQGGTRVLNQIELPRLTFSFGETAP